MCGIFGFIGVAHSSRPNMDLLRRIARETETRGRHAFGLAWVDQHDGLGHYRRPGSFSSWPNDLDRVEDSHTVIGHCRWATHGDQSKNRNNHPHVCGRGFVVHNGVVFNYRELATRYEIKRETECDTEVLGKLIARLNRRTLAERAAKAISETEGPLAILAAFTVPYQVLIARRGNPLAYCVRDEGIYLASLPGAMASPYAEVFAFRDDYLTVITRDGDGKLIFKSRTATVVDTITAELPTGQLFLLCKGTNDE